MPGRTGRARLVSERHGRPVLIDAMNDTMYPMPSTVRVVLSDTGCAVPSSQWPGYTPKDIYLLRRRTRGSRVNRPL
jgi:hypothetical protein